MRRGQAFLRGADFSGRGVGYTSDDLYAAAVRIFRTHTPVVAAVHGAAAGGGLGLALTADFTEGRRAMAERRIPEFRGE